jgi:hypothetical protein
VKLKEQLLQIEKRIAELRRKADWINSQLGNTKVTPEIPVAVVEEVEKAEEVLVEQPRRRGRRKLNETE